MSEQNLPCVEPDHVHLTLATPLSAHSRMCQRLRRRYEQTLSVLPDGPPTHATMQAALAELLAQGFALGAALRVVRQLVMERLVMLDCDQGAGLEVVTRAVTELAELALDRALADARATLDAT